MVVPPDEGVWELWYNLEFRSRGTKRKEGICKSGLREKSLQKWSLESMSRCLEISREIIGTIVTTLK